MTRTYHVVVFPPDPTNACDPQDVWRLRIPDLEATASASDLVGVVRAAREIISYEQNGRDAEIVWDVQLCDTTIVEEGMDAAILQAWSGRDTLEIMDTDPELTCWARSRFVEGSAPSGTMWMAHWLPEKTNSTILAEVEQKLKAPGERVDPSTEKHPPQP